MGIAIQIISSAKNATGKLQVSSIIGTGGGCLNAQLLAFGRYGLMLTGSIWAIVIIDY